LAGERSRVNLPVYEKNQYFQYLKVRPEQVAKAEYEVIYWGVEFIQSGDQRCLKY